MIAWCGCCDENPTTLHKEAFEAGTRPLCELCHGFDVLREIHGDGRLLEIFGLPLVPPRP